MDIRRRRNRFIVDIPVTITTVLDSLEARIIDLSEHGAQLLGLSLPTGTKFHIEYGDQTLYAQCIWAEIDRIGVRFPFDLTDGPLHDAMTMTASSADMPVSESFTGYTLEPKRASPGPGFGRRNAN